MIEVRAPREEDRAALDALYHEAFGYVPPEGFWQWKFGALPGLARQRVAVHAGGVVAHAGAIALPAAWSGGEAPVWQLVDFMGRTSGRGLRSALVAAGEALLAELPRPGDVPWIFGFPSPRHFRLGERTFGYRPLREIPVWEGALPEVVGAAGVEVAETADAGLEGIWRRCGVQGVRRSAEFLNWRYYARPGRYYRVYRLAGRGGEGFCVFGYHETTASAAELWCPSEADLPELLRAVVADLRGLGMTRWRFWETTPRLATAFRRLGLMPLPDRVFAGARGRMGAPDPTPAAAAFALAMGDYDLA